MTTDSGTVTSGTVTSGTVISGKVTSGTGNLRVLVIGGGVAGAACAIRLRQLGIEVTLAEKKFFPRTKVCGCCLGGTGIEQLKTLDVDREVHEAGMATDHWKGFLGGRTVDLPLHNGIAISRSVLDPILIAKAKQLGVVMRMGCEADVCSIDEDGTSVELTDKDQGCERLEFDITVIASGLKSGDAGGHLPWIEKPHGPFGISFSARCDQVEPGTIYMACDDDGYVGLVRLDENLVDVAAALRSGAEATGSGPPIDRVWRILKNSGVQFQFDELSAPMNTPPLRRARRSGAGRLIAIGDAAGYVEPFTGEGMTWAMQSGIYASNLIATHQNSPALLGHQWEQHSRRLLHRRKRTCRIMTTALRSSFARSTAAIALTTFPSLAAPLLKQLAKGSVVRFSAGN